MKSILIVKTSAIGDVIQTLPVLEYLNKRFPSCKIDWVVERGCADLLSAHPQLNRVLMIDTKLWRKNIFRKKIWREIFAFSKTLKKVNYDLVFDLQGNSKSAFVTFFARAKKKIGFGKHSVPEWPNRFVTRHKIEVPRSINVRLRYLHVVQTFLGDEKPFISRGHRLELKAAERRRLHTLIPPKKPAVMVAFGSKWANKRLNEETLQQFVQKIDARYTPFFLFIWGNEEEKKVAETLHALYPENSQMVGQLTLPLWQALMCEVDIVIAMDSAALHLCGTTHTPSFSIFGPSLASIYKPLGKHESFQAPCPYGQSFVHRCPKLRTCPTGACMRTLSADTLFDAFALFWEEKALGFSRDCYSRL